MTIFVEDDDTGDVVELDNSLAPKLRDKLQEELDKGAQEITITGVRDGQVARAKLSRSTAKEQLNDLEENIFNTSGKSSRKKGRNKDDEGLFSGGLF